MTVIAVNFDENGCHFAADRRETFNDGSVSDLLDKLYKLTDDSVIAFFGPGCEGADLVTAQFLVQRYGPTDIMLRRWCRAMRDLYRLKRLRVDNLGCFLGTHTSLHQARVLPSKNKRELKDELVWELEPGFHHVFPDEGIFELPVTDPVEFADILSRVSEYCGGDVQEMRI
jgi:hypothetical protein